LNDSGLRVIRVNQDGELLVGIGSHWRSPGVLRHRTGCRSRYVFASYLYILHAG
jgi:hypothetical protein